MSEPGRSPLDAPRAAYVHIPFCRRRCYYCDFPISVLGDRLRGEASGTIQQYLDLLEREIAHTPRSGQPLSTVFLGGGTPSLLSANQLRRILTHLEQHFGIAPDAEISIEMDPGTFDLEQLEGYLAAGITRISLGVQAFQTELLQACGRTHTIADIEQAASWLHQVGMTNFSLDLISGLPHQTMEQWQESLQAAIALQPAHLSVYDLTIEPATAFSKQYQPGATPLPSDDATAQMYRVTQQTLTAAGFEHYEISNYARSGYQCRHNRVYWENRPFYGFGMGAASYLSGQRFSRPRTRQDYHQWLEAWIASGGIFDCPTNTPLEVLQDTLMLGLRLQEGVNLGAIAAQFGAAYPVEILAALRPHQQRGWVQFVDECLNPLPFPPPGEAFVPGELVQNSKKSDFSDSPSTQLGHPATEIRFLYRRSSHQRLRLTDPEGFLVSNVILSDLFNRLEEISESAAN